MPFICKHKPARQVIRKGSSRRDRIDWAKAQRQREKQEGPIIRASLDIFQAKADAVPLKAIVAALIAGNADGVLDLLSAPELPQRRGPNKRKSPPP